MADATHEALTNVAKHAGVIEATLWADVSPTRVTVSVLDHGWGFDPAIATAGLGLPQSIRARIEAASGAVAIDSAPGAGTYVELAIPLPDTHAAAPGHVS
ncbi:hypothetical protein F0L68_27910 [Solihabitans fulvus]|uniref:Histidine kinase/HSP90-like ATPase domain-containing protein n=1 Tax=Solihabitans fulvus TaxID=1892852 RepID=A0A5B2WYK9_9PSEU|nr:hypothetical protein F0L68_27910 [Solihabitans fulvus]